MHIIKKKSICSILLAGMVALGQAGCGESSPQVQVPEVAALQAEAAENGKEAEDQIEIGGDPAQAAADVVTIVHEYGETQVPVNPAKIITFDLGILDILDSVGIEIGGLPSGVRPVHLSKFDGDGYVNAGSMKEADFEGINEYGPDVILITGRLGGSYEELSRIAPTAYFQMPGSDYMGDFRANVEILSRIFPDKAGEMRAKTDAIDALAEELSARARESGVKVLITMANDGSLSFFGSGSRYGMIHDTLGFAQADDGIAASAHGQESTFEYISKTNPDVLFVIDRSAAIGADGATGAAALLDNELVNGTAAAQNGKIIYLSSDIWYLAAGGIRSTEIMIEEAAAAVPAAVAAEEGNNKKVRASWMGRSDLFS